MPSKRVTAGMYFPDPNNPGQKLFKWFRDDWSRRKIVAIEGAGYQTSADVSAAIAAAIGGITELEYLVVSALPASGTKGVIYLVPHQHGTRDIYDEYIWVNNAFEKIGNTDVDLSQYLLKTDIATWAKQPNKPTYTASEVGALPSSTSIPTKTSDLTNDSDFQTGTQVGTAISAEAGLMIPYGYCTTAAATAAKTVTVSPAVTSLEDGLTIAVKFQYANTGSNPTLNVNSLGAKSIKRYGTTAAGTSAAANWNANSVVLLTYDGTYWMLVDWNNTTYSGMTDAEYQAGTGTSNRLITPARLKAAILHHAPVQSVNGATGAVTVSVPTKTSDLTNDSGFITSAPVASVNGQTGTVNLDAADVGALPDTTPIPTVPTNVSAFTNDAGYITGYTETDPTVPAWAKASTKPTYTATEVGALPDTTPIPSKTSDLTNDSGFITGYTETDPTVPAWAKAASKPSYTASEVGALPSSTVIPAASSATPAMDGTGAAGSSTDYARADHVHPSDTSKQDALSAAQLAAISTAANYPTYYGTCATAAATQEKAVTCPGFVLATGARIAVKFTEAQTYNATTAAPLKMNVNGTGAITVAYRDAYTVQRYYWAAAEVVEFVYDGTNFIMLKGGMATTTYYGITKLTNSLTSTNSALALNAVAGKSLQDQINALDARITALGG